QLKDFLELADLRGQLKNDIPDLEQAIKDLQTKLPQVAKAQNDLKDITQQLKTLEGKLSKSPVDLEQITSLTKQKALIENFLGGNTVETYQAELRSKQEELDSKRQDLRCVEKSISSFYSPDQKFKFWMSLFFA